jgi:hypothetical protein
MQRRKEDIKIWVFLLPENYKKTHKMYFFIEKKTDLGGYRMATRGQKQTV